MMKVGDSKSLRKLCSPIHRLDGKYGFLDIIDRLDFLKGGDIVFSQSLVGIDS
jgi:hypothetical protein